MGAGGQEDSCSRLVSMLQAGLHAAGWSPCSLLGTDCCLIACVTAHVHWYGGWQAGGFMQQAGLLAAGWSPCRRLRLVSMQKAGLHSAGWSPCSRLVCMQQAGHTSPLLLGIYYYHRACLLYYHRACLLCSLSRLRIRFKGAGGHESGPACVRGWQRP